MEENETIQSVPAELCTASTERRKLQTLGCYFRQVICFGGVQRLNLVKIEIDERIKISRDP